MPSGFTHDCPGCAAPVPRHHYACKLCWLRLPRYIRDRIKDSYQRDRDAHADAMREAGEWYEANP